MLLEFSVGNYRSFREDVTLSLVATSLRARDPDVDRRTQFEVPEHDLRVLRSAAVYGANASGKSNLVKALSFFRGFVLDSARDGQSGDAIDVTPFLFDPDLSDEPSYFEVVFLLDGVQYRYGFEATSEAVVAEWLYRKKERESLLFQRSEQSFTELRAEFRDQKQLTRNTRPNALFLSVCAQLDVPIAVELMAWFRARVGIVSGLADATVGYTADCLQRGTFDGALTAFLRALDLGIASFRVEELEIDPSALPPSLPPSARRGPFFQVEALHEVRDDAGEVVGTVPLHLFEESQGTQKLFALAGPIVDTLRKGGVMVIDEFDARLHPMVSRRIVEAFHDPEMNPHGAQLIVATHDTNLLSRDIFRRDQIWFVEKSRAGASDLYSLASFKPRNDASYEGDYIKGRYGAIPFLGGLKHALANAEATDNVRYSQAPSE